MNCMKCGKETVGENVFCQECLAVMEKYPVQPDSVVLPRRRENAVQKKAPKRHVPSAEELLPVLRRRVMILAVLLLICIGAIVLMFEPTMHYIRDEHFEIGQNYSSVTPAAPAPTE